MIDIPNDHRNLHSFPTRRSSDLFAPAQFLSLEHTAHPKLFEDQNYVWNALKQISSYLQFRLKPAVLGEIVNSSKSRSEEHTSELQSHSDLVCRLLLEKKKKNELN